MANTSGHALQYVALAALGAALFIPGVDIIAAPAFVAVLVTLSGGGKK